eukprot:scaffold82496_cov29-Tisochrysis_lutea.AAC.7
MGSCPLCSLRPLATPVLSAAAPSSRPSERAQVSAQSRLMAAALGSTLGCSSRLREAEQKQSARQRPKKSDMMHARSLGQL